MVVQKKMKTFYASHCKLNGALKFDV